MTELQILNADKALSDRAFDLCIKDGHFIPKPNYVAVRSGHIVGAFNSSASPFLFFWFGGSCGMLVAFKILKYAERLVKREGYPVAMIAISETSPFYPYMNKAGYSVEPQSKIMICALK